MSAVVRSLAPEVPVALVVALAPVLPGDVVALAPAVVGSLAPALAPVLVPPSLLAVEPSPGWQPNAATSNAARRDPRIGRS